MYTIVNLDEEIHIEVSNDHYFTTDSLYFELTEPEQISYVYKIKPARDFGVPIVSFRLRSAFKDEF